MAVARIGACYPHRVKMDQTQEHRAILKSIHQ